jgi:hypothetical protein
LIFVEDDNSFSLGSSLTMLVANKQDKRQDSEILTSINPNHKHFNFDAWAKIVRHQMLAALQKNLSSKRPKSCVDLSANMSRSSRKELVLEIK